MIDYVFAAALGVLTCLVPVLTVAANRRTGKQPTSRNSRDNL